MKSKPLYIILIVFIIASNGCTLYRKSLIIDNYTKPSRIYSREELISRIKDVEDVPTFHCIGKLKYKAGYIRGIRYAKVLIIGKKDEALRIKAFRNVITLFDLLVQKDYFKIYLKKDGVLISDSISELKKHNKLCVLSGLMELNSIFSPFSLIRDTEITNIKEDNRNYIVEVDKIDKFFIYKVQKENLIVSDIKVIDKKNNTDYEISFERYQEIGAKIVPMKFQLKIPERKIKLSIEFEKVRLNTELPKKAFLLDYPESVKNYRLADIEDIKF